MVLGLDGRAPCFGPLRFLPLAKDVNGHLRCQRTDSKPKIGESCLSRVELVGVLKDTGKGREHEVHITVRNGSE